MPAALRTMVMGLLLIFCLGVSGSVVDHQVAKEGWWIRIDPDLCEAKSITFHVGVTAKDRDYWFTWRQGDPTEFDLPEQLREEWQVYLHAMANPDSRKAWLCVFYKNRTVEHFKFSGTEAKTMKITDRDDCD